MTLSAGTRLGPYEVRAPLGSGGMGLVYRAHDPRIGRDVAIKILPTVLAPDPDRLRRFEQEARATGRLNHPNILTIFDTGRIESGGNAGAPFIVTELLEGRTLRDVLESGALAPREASRTPCRSPTGCQPRTRRGSSTATSSRRTCSSPRTVG